MTVRIAKPLSLRAGDQIVLVVVRGDRGSQCCSYDYQKKAAGLWPASIDERQGKLLRHCVRRDLLQIPEGVTTRKCRICPTSEEQRVGKGCVSTFSSRW